MSINTRISLGVAFLTKAITAHSSAKCILHAEYIVATKEYLLTKIVYAHNRSITLDVRSTETLCENVSDILKRLAKAVAAKVEDGFQFDSTAMEIMEEDDETWDDFQLAGTSVDAELDEEPDTAVIMQTYGIQDRRRAKPNENLLPFQRRKSYPVAANRIRNDLALKVFQQRVRVR